MRKKKFEFKDGTIVYREQVDKIKLILKVEETDRYMGGAKFKKDGFGFTVKVIPEGKSDSTGFFVTRHERPFLEIERKYFIAWVDSWKRPWWQFWRKP